MSHTSPSPSRPPTVVVAPDKFRGTATAAEAAATIAHVARSLGWRATELPLSDGGEGLLDALGGATHTSTVTGPDGHATPARWRLDGEVAVIEAAEACGLLLAGGRERNDVLTATSTGVGELIAAASAAGARRIVVGLGGSACTDGGAGALSALPRGPAPFGSVEVVLCADVATRYLDAAPVFGPQKGATATEVDVLADRLAATRSALRARFGRDPQTLPGSGAAGGLAGGLAAAGASIVAGFDHVADRLGLDEQLHGADLVITGEGRLDHTSLAGKVVGGVARRARATGTPVVAIVGDREAGFAPGLPVAVLTEQHGVGAAMRDVHGCLARTTAEVLAAHRPAR